MLPPPRRVFSGSSGRGAGPGLGDEVAGGHKDVQLWLFGWFPRLRAGSCTSLWPRVLDQLLSHRSIPVLR